MKTVYCIKDESKNVIYVGQTKNLQRRKREHRYKRRLPKTYTFEVLEECSDAEAVEKEKYYIALYHTIENGLNITHGNGQSGIVGTGFGGRFEKGNKAWSNRKIKKVRCLDNNVTYDNVKECAIALGIKNPTKIYSVCNGSRKSYHRFHFEYAD